MKLFSTLDVLKLSIAIENKEKAFYNTVAVLTENSDLEYLFIQMADEEELHIEYLLQAFKNLQTLGEFPNYDFKSKTNEVVEKILKTPKTMEYLKNSDFERLCISSAIEQEDYAIELYRERAEKVEDAAEKKLVSWLAGWEEKHHEVLIKLKDCCS